MKKPKEFKHYAVIHAYGSKKSEAGNIAVFEDEASYLSFIDAFNRGDLDNHGVYSIRLDRSKIGVPKKTKKPIKSKRGAK